MIDELLKPLWEAFKQVVSYINLPFCIIFIITTWLMNGIKSAWFLKISKTLRILLLAPIMIILFAWVFRYHSRMDYFGMILSVLTSMVFWKIGPKQILTFIKSRIEKI